MFQMLGVFAEFERGIIRERVNAGLARARQNGTKLGRRRIKPSVEAMIRELRAKVTASSRLPGRSVSAPALSRGSSWRPLDCVTNGAIDCRVSTPRKFRH
jgi:DNA invertase Pin-like site-specific DNA recombinase